MKKLSFKLKWIIVFIFIIFVGFLISTRFYAEEEVNVKSFGASGSGQTDETEFIQRAIDFQSQRGGGKIYFPKGTYLVDAMKSVILKDNIDLVFEKGAVLQALPNNGEIYEVLELRDVKNVNILGFLEIRGERDSHLGSTGQWGFGISIRGSNNINVENVKISDCWGDGIYIGSTPKQNYNRNINIINPILNNNRRQGISVISAIDLNIINAVITNTNGTPPQSGIDIEPNDNKEQLKNINIINLSTNNNKGKGLIVSLGRLNGSVDPISIYVDKTDNIKDSFVVAGYEGLTGKINISGYYYLTDKDKARISGSNRYNTAVAISKKGWNDTETILLAKGSDFPDALAGGPLAYQEGAPILLTHTTKLTSETRVEIERLRAKKVIILGDYGAISEKVEIEIKSMGLSIERIGGKTRFETAALIAEKLNSNRAIVVNGWNFPDVLSISSYASKNGVPILLTYKDQLSVETKSALNRVSSTYVIGSTDVVSNSVYSSLTNPIRIGGKDRYETGYEIATRLHTNPIETFISTGTNFPDALAGSVLAARYNAPILLVKTHEIPKITKKQLASYKSYLILGGENAVSVEVEESLMKN